MTYPRPESRDQDRPDVLEVGSERPRRAAPGWLLPALIVIVIVAATVAGVARLPGHHRVQNYPVVVTSTGRRLLGVRAGWEVFGRGPGSVVAISLAAGQVTTTQVPELASTSPDVAFIVGPHDAIIRSFDDAPGYVVPDGSAARPLTGALAADQPGPLLPGPRPGQAWVTVGSVHKSSLLLLGPDGRPTGATARLPPGAPLPATAIPDGRGDVLLLTGDNAVYDASPTGYWRVHANIVAVGPARWLGFVCGRLYCRDVVIDPATGAQRELPASSPALEAAFAWPSLGVTSPDGQLAAVPVYTDTSALVLLINLSTGASTRVNAPLAPSSGYQFMAWSPDSQWLFAVGAAGRLLAISVRTGRAVSVGVPLPPLSQVAVRAAPGSGP
jgi:hypothetical protein